MALASSEMSVVRSWVGDKPTDDELEERFERLGTVEDTIRETLRAQLSSMLSNPASLSTPSGLSVSFGENIRTLKARLEELNDQAPAGSGTAVLYRRDYR